MVIRCQSSFKGQRHSLGLGSKIKDYHTPVSLSVNSDASPPHAALCPPHAAPSPLHAALCPPHAALCPPHAALFDALPSNYLRMSSICGWMRPLLPTIGGE